MIRIVRNSENPDTIWEVFFSLDKAKFAFRTYCKLAERITGCTVSFYVEYTEVGDTQGKHFMRNILGFRVSIMKNNPIPQDVIEKIIEVAIKTLQGSDCEYIMWEKCWDGRSR